MSTQGLLYMMMLNFIVTFVVFPGVTFDTNLTFLSTLSNEEGWYIVILNTLFSIFDTVGRKMGGYKTFDLNANGIILMTFLRILFIATSYLAAFEISFFYTDWFIILNMCLFALTNGYVATLCAVKAPQTVESQEAKSQVGAFIGTTITLGILLGSIIAFAETPIVQMTPKMKRS